MKEPALLEDGWANGKFFDFELKELRAKKAQAQIGYLSMDLYKPPDGAFWGKWNNRRVIPSWISGLVATFKSSGVDNCADSTAIDVAVKREWVANLAEKCSTVEGKSIDEVPEMRFTDEGAKEIKPENLWILGGNHRRIALAHYLDGLAKEINALNDEIADHQGNRAGSENGDVKAAQDRVRSLEEKISSSRMWVVRLYDRGA